MDNLSELLAKLHVNSSANNQAKLPTQFYYKHLPDLNIGEAAEIYPAALHVNGDGDCSLSPKAVIFTDYLGVHPGYLRIERRDVNEYHVVIPADTNFRWELPKYSQLEELEFMDMMNEPDLIPVSSVEVVPSILRSTFVSATYTMVTPNNQKQEEKR